MEFVELIKSPRVDNVFLKRRSHQYVEGTLCVTGHHLIFSSRTEHKEELILLHTAVEYVEKKFSKELGVLIIFCKNFDIVRLKISNMEEALNVAASIEALSTIESPTLKYPFFYTQMKAFDEDGWELFSTEMEFAKICTATQNWKISHVNSNYEICSSYPATLIVPVHLSDEIFIKSAQFRQGGRFPVLSYFHKKTGVSLMRCGQPMTGGINIKRCKEDEKLVNTALQGQDKKGVIVDLRTQAAALNSRARGGGMETESNYPQWKRVHHGIERYSTLSDKISKLVEACMDRKLSMNSWLSKLESSGWLDEVQAVLSAACYVAQIMDRQGAPVLIHGDSGTDSTLQVTSLTQLLLDAQYRTVRGFESLVDREWVRAGHPFAERNIKVGVSSTKYKGQGPVFLLFLDCVWQIYQQFPCSFEFNEKFLITLLEHSYSSPYGTFLCNNEAQRVNAGVFKNTVSLWSYLNQEQVLKPLLNPMYEQNSSVLWPSVASQSLALWSGLFLKWRGVSKNQDLLWEEVRRVQEINQELQSKAVSLRREYAELQAKVLEETRKWKEEQEKRKPPIETADS